MWYLSRTPNDSSAIFSTSSIFSVSETKLFKEISIVIVPNASQTTHSRDDSDQQPNPCPRSPWEWIAFRYSPTILKGIAVPRSPSTTTQLIATLQGRYLCAKLAAAPPPHAVLCTCTLDDNSWHDVPKMQCEHRNPIAAAGAILYEWLYLAGGYEGNPIHAEPSTYLKSAERLNLRTWEWQALPSMLRARAFATGVAHRDRFLVFGGATAEHPVEIYNPHSNSWLTLGSFLPTEADGYAVTSMFGNLLMLTWSDQLGVKLWRCLEDETIHAYLIDKWRLISLFPDNAVARLRLRQHGAKLVQVGKEVFVLTGDISDICDWRVFGTGALPVFPAPTFRPDVGDEVVPEGHIYAFSIQDDGAIHWRQIPVYMVRR